MSIRFLDNCGINYAFNQFFVLKTCFRTQTDRSNNRRKELLINKTASSELSIDFQMNVSISQTIYLINFISSAIILSFTIEIMKTIICFC